MSKRSRFLGKLRNDSQTKNINVQVDVIEYEDDGIFYAYSPALDLIGYGISLVEARQSWETILQEYFTYTMNKKTLTKDLLHRGWIVRKGNKEFRPPSFSWLLQNNRELVEMYDKHNFQKTSRPISVPLATLQLFYSC